MSTRYTVVATCRDAAVKEEYVAWLKGGHMQAVMQEGGASSAEIDVLESAEGQPIKLEAQYVFESRVALQVRTVAR